MEQELGNSYLKKETDRPPEFRQLCITRAETLWEQGDFFPP